MRANPTRRIEKFRVCDGVLASDASYGAGGAFRIPYRGDVLHVIAHDGSRWSDQGLPGDPWEHVSVSLVSRCPTWEEMDFVRQLFWGDDETVLQLHVPRAQHVNFHPYCLHLWRPIGVEIPLPPSVTVGPRKVQS